MKKILVTTDFSANSKKAIRFAMQLASQNNYKLLFYNVTSVMKKPSIWDNIYYGNYESAEIRKNQEKLEKFITRIHQETTLPTINSECVCEVVNALGFSVGKQIMHYANEVKVDYICVSTRGSGTIDKLFGTIASELIIKSTTPVFVVPRNYRINKFTSICYASDIENIDAEIRKVTELAHSLKAKVKVMHYDYGPYLKIEKGKLSNVARKYESEDILFHYKKLNPKFTLNYHIRKDVMLIKPSLLVLFTKQNRKWFDRLFATSHSTNMSFSTKVPMLVFRKEEKQKI
ncbi:universal stress protein [Flavobacterium sp.]|uniref:universal stress protein n=1 Tax=Flavobacterium sp. TaxID=239 RepID=UPI00286E3388|nr:universal stress protein [Flavobacterium sp.]